MIVPILVYKVSLVQRIFLQSLEVLVKNNVQFPRFHIERPRCRYSPVPQALQALLSVHELKCLVLGCHLEMDFNQLMLRT